MEKRNYKVTAAVLCCLLLLSLRFLTMTGESASNVPSLFINDSKYLYHESFPLEIVDGVEYVSVLFITSLGDMKLTTEENGDFCIEYRNNRFIAVDVSENRAIDKSLTEFECKTYTLHQVRYVPAELVAKSLGFKVEINKKYKSLRMLTVDYKRTFDELIEKYTEPETVATVTVPPTTTKVPAIIIPQTTPAQQITEPEKTTTKKPANPDAPKETTVIPTTAIPPTTTAEVTAEINNYFIFDIAEQDGTYPPDEKINGVIQALDSNNVKALFLADKKYTETNASKIAEIFFSGNTIALKISPEDEIKPFSKDEMKSKLEGINDINYKLLKNKISLFYIEKYSQKLTGADIMTAKSLAADGYSFIYENYTSSDFEHLKGDNDYITQLKMHRINIIRFGFSEYDTKKLNSVIRACNFKFYLHIKLLDRTNTGF